MNPLGVFLCASIQCLWKYSECLRTLLDSLAESTSFSQAWACDICASIWVHMREPMQMQRSASEYYHAHSARRRQAISLA